MNAPQIRCHSMFSLACAIVFALPLGEIKAQQAVDKSVALRGLDSPGRIQGEYIVVLNDDSVSRYMSRRSEADPERAVHDLSQDFALHYGGRVEFTYGHAIRGFAVSGIDEHTAMAISQDPNVAFVETSKVYTADAEQSPAPWGLDRIDQRNLPLSNSYSYTQTGFGVSAYVVDSGIKRHDEFKDRKFSIGYTAINDGYGSGDCFGHGTHVAGILGGTTYGVAKGVRLVSVRVLDCQGSGSSTEVVAGLNWIAMHAVAPAVVNMSLRTPVVDSSVESAVSTLLNQNITVVVAAGNTVLVHPYGITYGDACWYTPARMGQSSDVLTVANSTNTDARNVSSNWGHCVTLFAPGTDITSAGIGSASATTVMTGTSMSSPHVAGAAALYLQTNPTATPAMVKSAIVFASTRGAISDTGSSPNRLLYTGFGQSGGSDPVLTPVPTAPSGLDSQCLDPTGLFRLSWNASSGDVGAYEVWWQNMVAAYTTETEQDVGVGGGATDGWKVRACNGAGCSAFSNIHNVPWVPNSVCP